MRWFAENWNRTSETYKQTNNKKKHWVGHIGQTDGTSAQCTCTWKVVCYNLELPCTWRTTLREYILKYFKVISLTVWCDAGVLYEVHLTVEKEYEMCVCKGYPNKIFCEAMALIRQWPEPKLDQGRDVKNKIHQPGWPIQLWWWLPFLVPFGPDPTLTFCWSLTQSHFPVARHMYCAAYYFIIFNIPIYLQTGNNLKKRSK